MSRTVLLFGLAMSLVGGLAAAQDATPAAAQSAPAEISPLIAGPDALGESLKPDDLIGRRGARVGDGTGPVEAVLHRGEAADRYGR